MDGSELDRVAGRLSINNEVVVTERGAVRCGAVQVKHVQSIP